MINNKKIENEEDRATDFPEITNDILLLLRKYRGGRIPILADAKHPPRGLLNAEVLQIYQKGFSIKYANPFAFLLIVHRSMDESIKWLDADYSLNDFVSKHWTQVCQTIRKTKYGDETCEYCDRQHAEQAEKANDVICYMCTYGMVDFAMPIFVDGEIVAVLFAGQRTPKKGSYWNNEFVEPNGIYRALKPDESGVDAWQTTLERFKDAEESCDLEPNTLATKLEEDLEKKRCIEITPKDVQECKEILKKAGQHLSDLAESTYRLEKNKLVGALRSIIVRSVAKQEVDIEHVKEALPAIVDGISKAAKLVCKYFGIDYMFVVNINAEISSFRFLLEVGPCKSEWRTGMWVPELDEERFDGLADGLPEFSELNNIDLWPLRKLPFFDWVGTWLKGKKAGRSIAMRLNHAGLTSCVLLAGRERGLQLSDFRKQDRDDFNRIAEDIATVMNVVLLIDELDAAGKAQELFLEDVAHDIRSPVQTLLTKMDLMKLSLNEPDILRKQIDKLGSQIRRISRLSERVWVLEQVRQNRLKLDTTQSVNVYEVAKEAVAIVEDVAIIKGITLLVDRKMEKWRAISNINRDLFFHAILNLVDNAVKYGRKGTEVRIDGTLFWPGCEIKVGNIGIEIKDKYRKTIFKRGFQTPEAKMHIRQGSGIGLCIVKAFVDFYGEISYKCDKIGSRPDDYLTIFELTIRGDLL